MNTFTNSTARTFTPTKAKAKKFTKRIALYAFAGAVACNSALSAFATTTSGSSSSSDTTGVSEVTSALDTLKNIVSAICTGLGAIIALWGVVSFATSMTAQNAEQRKHGIIELIAGLLIAFAPSILKALGVNL